MSRLSDLVHRVVDETRNEQGAVRIHEAVESIKPKLEEEDRDRLVSEALSSRCKSAAQKGKNAARAAHESVNSTLSLFPGLRVAYAIDVDDRVVKDTRSLSMLEFSKLISIREKQIRDDSEHLKILRNAWTSAEPFWTRHPDRTFGYVCDALVNALEPV